MFTVEQNVWCAIHGAGVVSEIRHPSEGMYPVEVKFDDTYTAIYTSDGRYYVDSNNVVLFPYPIEIVKAVTKPSIDWSHVSSGYYYLVQDSDGEGYLCSEKPSRVESGWEAGASFIDAAAFTSYTPGTCNWQDSLVERP